MQTRHEIASHQKHSNRVGGEHKSERFDFDVMYDWRAERVVLYRELSCYSSYVYRGTVLQASRYSWHRDKRSALGGHHSD